MSQVVRDRSDKTNRSFGFLDVEKCNEQRSLRELGYIEPLMKEKLVYWPMITKYIVDKVINSLTFSEVTHWCPQKEMVHFKHGRNET